MTPKFRDLEVDDLMTRNVVTVRASVLSITDIARVARERSLTRPGFDISPVQVVDTLNVITNAPLKTAGVS